ncbi:DNA-binding response regulator [Subtercola lobariae]|uniref:DNA-binding response regulator n=1 Tax=Subtercola lobariae TaxID=1588641 RepID=A0A917B759_9MICO|nr:DNA-binding response regulator [Subtercola lobariae]
MLIVDDQALIRSAVREIVRHEPGFEITGEAVNGEQAVELAESMRPDVVLMDIRMPVLDGLAATRLICGNPELAAVKVLILTTFEEDEYILEALRSGASGFIGKGTEPADLLRALRTVHDGNALLSPTATKSLIDRYVRPPGGRSLGGSGSTGGSGGAGGADALPAVLASLTDRELEILVLVASGLSNDDIAARLVISPLTAKTHVNRTMLKLGAHDRAQLVIIAYETGLIVPGVPLT